MDKPHKSLKAWQLAMDITEKIYTKTESFPAEEKFGLVSHIRRSAISIPSNIDKSTWSVLDIMVVEEDKTISGLNLSQKEAF